MEDNTIRYKAKYFIPFYGFLKFGEENKDKSLIEVKETLKFLSLTACMYIYHIGIGMSIMFNKEICQGLENLVK